MLKSVSDNIYNTIQYLFCHIRHLQVEKKMKKLMTENKWRENLKETTRLITSQAFSLKITNLILELQYGLMVINFDRAHVHTHAHTHTHTHTHIK